MTSSTTQPVVEYGTYSADPIHSSVGFAVRHMVVATFQGQFDGYSARVVSDESGVRIEGTVDVTSVAVKNPDLEAHLMSPEFFDAERHPEIRFVSEAIRRDGDSVEVDGQLTIRGTTLPVTATGTIADPAEDAFGTVRLGLELEAVVDRTAYGLNWNAPLPKGGFALSNDVKLRASLSLAKES